MSAQYCDAKDLNWYLGPIIALTVRLSPSNIQTNRIVCSNSPFLSFTGFRFVLWVSRKFGSYI